MTTETKGQTNIRTAKTYLSTVANRFEKRRSWVPCPRCIGGNMYLENNGEFVCIQCGCSCFPDAVTKTPHLAKGTLKPEPNLFQDISDALRTQRAVHISSDTDTHIPDEH